MSQVNSQPRKSLGGKSPIQVFKSLYGEAGKDFLDSLGVEKLKTDELQLVYFGILGLRSDLSIPEEEGGLAETEFEEISNMINDLEVMHKTKTMQLDCFNTDSINDMLDTMEEELYDDYNVL